MELDSPFFTRNEMACQCGCGFDTVDSELLNILNCIRTYFDSPVIITSGCRCAEHNKKIGGAPKSLHTQARAADFYVKGVPLETVHEFCTTLVDGSCGLGYYPREHGGWIHIDSRTGAPARWQG